MPNQASLIHRFLSFFSRRSEPLTERRAERSLESESAFARNESSGGYQDIPNGVIVRPSQSVVLVQIERRKTVADPKK